ncbi:MAG: hypothetical protein ACI9VR_000948 [Cognaticolwellia sp.]
MSTHRKPWRAWAVLIGLNVLLLVPATLGLDKPAPWLALGLCVDFLVLAAGIAWARRFGVEKPSALAGGALVLALFAFEVMRLIGVFAMGQDPLLYDLGFLLRHMLVLLSDVGTFWDALRILGVVLGLFAVGVGAVVGMFRASEVWAAKAPWLSALAVVAFGLSFLGRLHPGATRWPARLVLPHMVENLSESWRVYNSVNQTIAQDPYRDLTLDPLSRSPELRVFIVESYGQLIFEQPVSGEPITQHLRELETALGAQGWYSVSGRSEAPVSGGRSWIADASLYSGLKISYESVFQHLKPSFVQRRTLPSFLSGMGYKTVVVEPKDRARPGVELENEFGFDETVFYADLDWQGPEWGWGIIPDQHTLGWLREKVIEPAEKPLFISFHMVASHVPWRSPPPLLEDWRELADQPLGQDHIESEEKKNKKKKKAEQETPPSRDEAIKRLGRYQRVAGMQHSGVGGIQDEKLLAYADVVHYDLEALAQHLQAEGSERPMLVVIMGDHQPPFLAKRMGFGVPVHVLATDPALLVEFEARGFVPGMVPPTRDRPEIQHQSLFPALVRSLARYDGQAPPELHPDGVMP